jgi:hypothetical protein
MHGDAVKSRDKISTHRGASKRGSIPPVTADFVMALSLLAQLRYRRESNILQTFVMMMALMAFGK